MNELMKPVIVLTAICVVAAALLGFTYNITAPLIAQAEEDVTNAAMAEVVPGATSFTPCELSTPIEGVLAVSQADGGLGYAIQVQDQGYGGAYVVMVGIGPDGMITGAKLTDNSETPGLGSKTGTEDFTSQFIGKDRSLEGVETISGATISSSAFLRCIDTAYQAYDAVGEGA